MASSTTYNSIQSLLNSTPTSNFDTTEYRNRIADADKTNAQTNADYQAQKNTSTEAQNAYKEAVNNATSYQDYWNQAKEDAGLNAAKEQYQKSLNAVNATQAAMNTLPSRVNAGSNVVLNQNQKNALLAKQQTAYGNTLNNWTNQNAADASMYQNILGEAQTNASGNVAYQQQQIENKLTDYQTALTQLNTLHDQLINEREQIRNWYGDMYDNYYRDLETQLSAWQSKLSTEASMYASELDAEAQNYAANIQKYIADMSNSNNSSYKNWDFGNGYSVQEDSSGNARYFQNGNEVSAGRFLEATGANGANWDLWNDIWNNGVSTRGVGSDTVNAFNYVSPTSSKYEYLF